MLKLIKEDAQDESANFLQEKESSEASFKRMDSLETKP